MEVFNVGDKVRVSGFDVYGKIISVKDSIALVDLIYDKNVEFATEDLELIKEANCLDELNANIAAENLAASKTTAQDVIEAKRIEEEA